MPICFAHKRILQLRREIFFVRHEGVHARFWTRFFLHGSLYSESYRSTCKDRASIACHIPEHRPFACCVPKRFLLLLRSDLVSYATKAYMHGCGRGLLHGSLFSESYRSTCKDRTSIACQISENCPCVRTQAFTHRRGLRLRAAPCRRCTLPHYQRIMSYIYW